MKKNPLRRRLILFFAKLLFMIIFSFRGRAGLEYACWTDPLAVMVLTSGYLASHNMPPKKGVYGRLFYDESLKYFSGICNNPEKKNGIMCV